MMYVEYFKYFSVILILACTSHTSNSQNTSVLESQCMPYEGEFCRDILNTTVPRFINTTIGFNTTEDIAVKLGDQIDKIFDTSQHKECQPLVYKVVCFYLFPMCNKHGKKVEYCQDDCKFLFKVCGGEFNKLVGAGKVVLQGKLSGDIFKFDECDQDLQTDDENCVHLPFIDIPAEKKAEDDEDAGVSLTLIIIFTLVVPVIILLVAILVYLQIKNRKLRAHSIHYEKDDEQHSDNKDRLSNIISMRDRIREWKLAPSEMLELIEICKKRGVKEILVDDIEYLKDLGSGQYGLVFQGKMKEAIVGEDSRIVAVKTLREGSSSDAIKEFCQEVNIMSTFSHPHVVKLIGVSLADEPYCMIFEFVEFGDLASFLRNCVAVDDLATSSYPHITVTDQIAMALQIASAMKYISSIRCIHRDLAARNCLVARGLVVKISDFGLSRDVHTSEYYRMEKTRMLPVRWLPPEAFTVGKFTVFSDIYSYGVLLWEIFTFAKLPYEDYDNTKTMELILDGQILGKPEACPDAVYDIMKLCWHSNPEERILFPDVINELCSLDDVGQRFQANQDELVDNYSRRIMAETNSVLYDNTTNSLSYKEKNLMADEAPINVERLPTQQQQENQHYSTPKLKRNILNNKKDDVAIAVETTADSTAGSSYMNYRPPSSPVHTTAQRSSSSSQLIHDEPQEDYDVPPIPTKHHHPDTTGITMDNEEQEVYDVPPAKEDLYNVPQLSQPAPYEPQETYDVPPKSSEGPTEIYQCPPKSLQRQYSAHNMDNDGSQEETYDIPPIILDDPPPDDIYQNPQTKKNGDVYSVPQSPYLQRRRDKGAENGEEKLEKSPQSMKSRGRAYENVGFDGKPLLNNNDN